MNVEREIERLRGEVNMLMNTARETTPWTDYSSLSTVVGWSSFTAKIIRYMRVGKLVFVKVVITGTSNSAAVTFTVPVALVAGSGTSYFMLMSTDNGGTTVPGVAVNNAGSALITVYPTLDVGNWTASGTKTISGQFWYVAG